MYINFSYEQEFIDLMFHLRTKYPKSLAELEGIGSSTDVAEFSRKFFQTKTTNTDVSIDPNGNQAGLDLATYGNELPKPIFKLNSYYVLWKKIRQLYGSMKAADIIEKQYNGTIYINDFHGIGAGLSYSYHPDTVLEIVERLNGKDKLLLMTMEEFFHYAKGKFTVLDDREEKNLQDLNFFGENFEYFVFDEGGNLTKINYVLRHRPHHLNKIVYFETLGGSSSIVTGNHPVIMTNDKTTLARHLVPGEDYIKSQIRFSDSYIRQVDFENNSSAYLMGRASADDKIGEHAKNIEAFGKSYNYDYRIPVNILSFSRESLLNFIAGVIDSDICSSKANIRSLSISSNNFGYIQKLAEIMRCLDFMNVHVRSGRSNKRSKYRLTFVVNDKKMLEYSSKIQKYNEWFDIPSGGRTKWKSPKLNRKFFVEEDLPYVYDITTESGQFYSQGLIQHNCFNYSAFDIMLQGLPMIQKIKSIAPKYLTSFKSQLEQFITIASNSTLGATGIADVFIVMSHYVETILTTMRDKFEFKSEEDCWSYVKENIVSFVYTINQPMRGGAQSPFTNVSIYDDYFLDELLPTYAINGKAPDKAIVKKVQELFLDIMNEELERTSCTFPVTTACFSIDDNNRIMDEAFLDMIAEKDLKFGFINLYCGKTSTLSSCCFDPNTEITVINEGIKMKSLISDFVDYFIKDVIGELKVETELYVDSLNENNELEPARIVGVLKKYNDKNSMVKIIVGKHENIVTLDHVYKVRKSDGSFLELNAQEIEQKVKDEELLVPVKSSKTSVSWEKIDSAELIDYAGLVYDIELEKNHYFPANRIVSHNCRLRSDTMKTEYEITDENGDIHLINAGRILNVTLEDGTQTEMTMEEIIKEGIQDKVEIDFLDE